MIFSLPLIPAKAGTQCFGRWLFEAMESVDPRRPASQQNWVPAFAGMSGGLG
jgi:hypothetical protein